MRTVVIATILLANMAFITSASHSADNPVDVANGKRIFSITCQNCHSAEIGVDKIGPSLWGVVGRKAGTVPDFNYSEALKSSGVVWNEQELDNYLANPRGTIHDVKMWFKGLSDQKDREDVIAYLKTLG